MTTLAEITEGLTRFDPITPLRPCPRCGTVHQRVDFLCEGCRTKDTRNKRAAGLKGQRVLKRMRAARASNPEAKVREPERKCVDAWPNPSLMLSALLSKVGNTRGGR